MPEKPTYEELEQRVRELEARRTLQEQSSIDRLIGNIQAGVVVHGSDGAVVRTNTTAQIILGLTDEQMLGKDLIDPAWTFLREDGSSMPVDEYPVSQVLKNKSSIYNLIIGIKHSEKSEPTWCLDTAIPEFDENGNISQIITTFMDISSLKKAEEALIVERQRLSMLLEAFPGFIYLQAPDYSVTFANQYFLDHFGDPQNRPCYSVLWNRQAPCEPCHTFKVFDTKKPQVWEWSEAPDGKYYMIHDCPFIDVDGTELVLEIGIDITEQKIAEEELNRTLDATTDGIWTWNFKTDELFFSPKYYTMLGYEPEEFSASYENWVNLIHLDDRQKAMAVAEEYLKTKPDTYENEFRMRTSTGNYRWILATARVVERDKNGDAVYMIGNHQDITERKQAEEALRRSEEQYRLLVENANDAIFIAQDGVILFPNPKTTDITGYSADELSNMPFTDIIHPEDRDLVLGRHRQRLKGGNPLSHYSFRIINKAGEELWVQLNTALLTWKDQPATINIIRDITEQRQLENRLRQSQKMESIGTLAGGIAHDFNNILSPILGHAELALEDVKKGSSLEENLQEIFNAGIRARDLVKQILTFARTTKEEIKPVRVSSIAKEALKFIQSTTPTFIEIQSDIGTDALVLADPTHIHQVLINLCTNSCQAMEEKGGVLEVNLTDVRLESNFTNGHPEMEPGNYMKLTVSDTGPGIPSEILDRIFEPFFTTKEEGEGTGMGLSTVHGIIKTYGGTITVESETGKGSVFTVYLPAAPKAKGRKPASKDVLPSGTEKVLVVDDEPPLLKMYSQALERLGYQVTTRSSSIEALELFKARPQDFDIVVTDMTMPDMTGDRLAKETMRVRPDIPVILCTGFSKRISEEKAAEIGIKAFVMKPVSATELAKTVRKVLDKAEE